MSANIPDVCYKCLNEKGTLVHCLWEYPKHYLLEEHGCSLIENVDKGPLDCIGLERLTYITKKGKPQDFIQPWEPYECHKGWKCKLYQKKCKQCKAISGFICNLFDIGAS